ncbi:MAG: hypothetical protein K2G23_00590, partial [Muribaculaceae bacterium]|nr:hypothetical protein [Muribaculaceae bacterium]
SKFNGRIVAKVLSPEKIVMSKDYITNTQADGKTIYVPSPDYRLGEFKGIVKDGEYEMEITVPDAAIVTPGDTLRLMLSAYDPERKLAASGKIDLILAEGSTSGNKDTQDPALMMSYEEAGCLQINVSDNVGLSGDCIEVFIDENPTAYKLVDSDDCFRNLEFNVATDRLTDGPHTLRVRAKDQAANLTEETLDFIKKQDEPTLALMVDHKAVKDSIQFDLDSESDGNWILVITDANGAEIFRDAFNGTSLNWSCTNSSGVKVMPGLYNAMVRSADKVSDYKFSAKVSFAVIE